MQTGLAEHLLTRGDCRESDWREKVRPTPLVSLQVHLISGWRYIVCVCVRSYIARSVLHTRFVGTERVGSEPNPVLTCFFFVSRWVQHILRS